MLDRRWFMRATERGPQLVITLRTPSGGHAGERRVDLPASRPTNALEADRPPGARVH